MDCSSITDFQQSTAISIAKKFRNLHIGISRFLHVWMRSDYVADVQHVIMVTIVLVT